MPRSAPTMAFIPCMPVVALRCSPDLLAKKIRQHVMNTYAVPLKDKQQAALA